MSSVVDQNQRVDLICIVGNKGRNFPIELLLGAIGKVKKVNPKSFSKSSRTGSCSCSGLMSFSFQYNNKAVTPDTPLVRKRIFDCFGRTARRTRLLQTSRLDDFKTLRLEGEGAKYGHGYTACGMTST